ncbi:hypothetical protein V2S66_24560 [Streptomyces sp. V4-01]|uniref:SGNH hydrolase-type esterase domain-containing protein n=1 Tax=Actinacidiphila polyblastidii TaxID=3110430 RepID=A0ABU7PHE7_9ACTN|nr:hypothetical protein [Streptomyces sp. V4-01]
MVGHARVHVNPHGSAQRRTAPHNSAWRGTTSRRPPRKGRSFSPAPSGSDLSVDPGCQLLGAPGRFYLDQDAGHLRTSGAFDGVVDFDRAVADPADPTALAPAYDSGDHLHPDEAGMQALENAVDLSLLS